jgi:hypothetical protein
MQNGSESHLKCTSPWLHCPLVLAQETSDSHPCEVGAHGVTSGQPLPKGENNRPRPSGSPNGPLVLPSHCPHKQVSAGGHTTLYPHPIHSSEIPSES